MITRIIIATVAASFVTLVAFGQTKYSRTRAPSPSPTPTPAATAPPRRTTVVPPQPKQLPVPAQKPAPTPTQSRLTATPAPNQFRPPPTPAPTLAKPTPTPVPPPDVKAYLDRQVANSKDKKFHFTVNGKDLALTPFHVWAQKSTGSNTTSTSIDMKSDDGRIYDIDFATTGSQVTSIRIHRINGEAVR